MSSRTQLILYSLLGLACGLPTVMLFVVAVPWQANLSNRFWLIWSEAFTPILLTGLALIIHFVCKARRA